MTIKMVNYSTYFGICLALCGKPGIQSETWTTMLFPVLIMKFEDIIFEISFCWSTLQKRNSYIPMKTRKLVKLTNNNRAAMHSPRIFPVLIMVNNFRR